jgi:hypothetical protein
MDYRVIEIFDNFGPKTERMLLLNNIYYSCSLIFYIIDVVVGSEGSAHDARVLKDAMLHGFSIIDRKYYLGDAGYSLSNYCLTPYRGVRYHLKEWAAADTQPQNKEELFNLRHASLRYVIERSFGVLKKRFQVLHNMNTRQYSFDLQYDLILCCFIIHNFIRMNALEEDIYYNLDAKDISDNDDLNDVAVNDNNDRLSTKWRDDIASLMWDQYQAILQQRNHK